MFDRSCGGKNVYCIQCCYNLAYLSSRNCPECGRAFDPTEAGTFLDEPVALLPLLGRERSMRLGGYLRQHRWSRSLLLLIVHAGLRAAGAGFLAMMVFIAAGERRAGIERTHWDAVLITTFLIGAGFYVSHALLAILRYAGARDRI